MTREFKVGDKVRAIPEECDSLYFEYPADIFEITEVIQDYKWSYGEIGAYFYNGDGVLLPASCLELVEPCCEMREGELIDKEDVKPKTPDYCCFSCARRDDGRDGKCPHNAEVCHCYSTCEGPCEDGCPSGLGDCWQPMETDGTENNSSNDEERRDSVPEVSTEEQQARQKREAATVCYKCGQEAHLPCVESMTYLCADCAANTTGRESSLLNIPPGIRNVGDHQHNDKLPTGRVEYYSGSLNRERWCL